MLKKDFLSAEIYLRDASICRNPGIAFLSNCWKVLSVTSRHFNSSAGMMLLINMCWRPIYAAN